MRKLGFLLLTVGFFGAAFVAVRHNDAEALEWQTIEWNWYIASFLVGMVGVILLRVTAKGSDTQTHKLDADIEAMIGSLSSIVSTLDTFRAGRDSISVYDIHGRIDDELVTQLGIFVEARETMIHRFGIQEYANVMSQFASGERMINRAWSASADGYIDEVWKCLDKASVELRCAQSLFNQYQGDTSEWPVRPGTDLDT